ncbi:hypothetical protein M0812_29085 [Anaeramoeba flamelloides]|uniref:PB1 domain-containing protein n=1 Tax=Anaeramoeba flamelloides TaxID=1746091 RepID=A0AAV7Y6W7_9EUKA|nr:hypothetical protein M0812_29085 [Anaeramoeba flamelloides]
MNEEMNKIERKETISIKVYYDEDCRRFSVSENITYNEFCNLLEEILSVEFKKDQCALRYQDEEDEFIFFSTDLELSEAIKSAQTNEVPVLKLFVSSALELEQEREKEKEQEQEQDIEIEFEQERYYGSSDSSTSSEEDDLMIPYLPRKLYKELQEFLLQMQEDLDQLLKNELFTKLLESNYLQLLKEYQQIITNGEKQAKLFSNYLDKLLENVEIELEMKEKIKNVFVLIDQKMRKIKEDHPKFPFELIFKNISETPFPDLLNKIKEGCQNKFQRKVHKRKCKHKHKQKWKKYLKDNKEKNVNRKFKKEKKWKKYKNKKYGKKQDKYLKYKYRSGKMQCDDPMDDEFNKKKFHKCKNKCNRTRERERFGGRRRGRGGFGRRGRGRGRGRRRFGGRGRGSVRRFSDDFSINMKNNAYSKRNYWTKAYDRKFQKKKYSKEKKEQKKIERQQWKLYKKQLRKEKRDFKKQLRKQKKLFKNKLRKEKKQFKLQRKQNTKHYRKNNSKYYRNKFHQENVNKRPFYQEELTILENIGFVNRDLNLQLLKSYNGDVKQTIQALLY